MDFENKILEFKKSDEKNPIIGIYKEKLIIAQLYIKTSCYSYSVHVEDECREEVCAATL